MAGQSALIWIVILLLILIIVLLSVCLYVDVKPLLAMLTTAESTSDAPLVTTPPPETTKAPVTTAPPETTKAPVTTAPPVTTKAPVTTSAPITDTPTPDPDAPTICIDPGHGFEDPGTLGKLNGVTYYESDINLAIAKELGRALNALGYNVVYTHDGKNYPSSAYLSASSPRFNVNNRCDWIIDRKSEIDLVISVHCNAYSADTSVKGSRYYILPYGYTGYTKYSEYLAKKLTASVKSALSLSKEPTVYTQKLAVLQSGLPSVLLECGFMTNTSDLKNLLDASWQKRYAAAIASGIDAYCRQYIK